MAGGARPLCPSQNTRNFVSFEEGLSPGRGPDPACSSQTSLCSPWLQRWARAPPAHRGRVGASAEGSYLIPRVSQLHPWLLDFDTISFVFCTFRVIKMQYLAASTNTMYFSWEAFTCKSQIGFKMKYSSFCNILEPLYRIT